MEKDVYQPIPNIINGKLPNEPINALHGFYLPPQTPYGNLTLKIYRIIQRLDHVNLRIKNLNEWFDRRQKKIDTYELDSMSLEVTDDICLGDEITFWIKRTADELISLIYIKEYWINNEKKFPDQILVDNIGSLLNDPIATSLRDKFPTHIRFLDELNKIANAHKHSFIGTDIVVTSGSRPQIFALELHRNNLKNEVRFYVVPVGEVIEQFNYFYKDSIEELKKWSVLCLS